MEATRDQSTTVTGSSFPGTRILGTIQGMGANHPEHEWGSLHPPAERTESVRHILDHYKPSDADTWDEVREDMDFRPGMMGHARSVYEEVRDAGEVKRPIPIDYEQDPPRVMNGHTRVLSAEQAGVEHVPTRQHWGLMDPDDPDHMGNQPYHRDHWTNVHPEWFHAEMAERGQHTASARIAGMIDLYHHTTPENARSIVENDHFDADGDRVDGDPDDFDPRVYFSDKPSGGEAGRRYGPAAVHVRFPESYVEHEGEQDPGENWYSIPADHLRSQHIVGLVPPSPGGKHEAAARPPRGSNECICCHGEGEHHDGSKCTSCQGLGHRPKADRNVCPGQPAPRRRHWRQRSAVAGKNGPLPDDIDFTYTPGDRFTAHSIVAHPRGEEPTRANRVGRLSWIDGPNGDGHIINLGVDPDHQRRGIATEMFRRAQEVSPVLHHSSSPSPDAQAWIAGMEKKSAAMRTVAKAMSWYHASSEESEPGDEVRPAAEVGRETRGGPGDEHRAWVSNDPIRAGAYGAHIYEVTPHAKPKHTRGPADEHETTGATVVRRVPHEEARQLSPSYQEQARAYERMRALQAEAAAEPEHPSFVHEYETMGPTGYETNRKRVHGPFYHGGRAKLGPGGLITPGRKPNSWGDEFDERGRSIHTYFATDPSTAASYARSTKGHMYEVEPTGESKRDGSGGDGAFKSKHPLRVIRRIPPEEWDSLPHGGHQEDVASQEHTAALEDHEEWERREIPPWDGRPLYHGSRTPLREGDELTHQRAAEHANNPDIQAEPYMHVTTSPKEAHEWGDRADGGQAAARAEKLGRQRWRGPGQNDEHVYLPRVYRVIPGRPESVEPDPHKEGMAYRTPHALHVAEEVHPLTCYHEDCEASGDTEHWPDHPHYEFLKAEQDERDEDEREDAYEDDDDDWENAAEHHEHLQAGAGRRALPAGSGGPLGRANDAVSEELAGFQPHSAADLRDFYAELPSFFQATAAAMTTLAGRMRDQMPIAPEVADQLTELVSVATALADMAEETNQVFRHRHARELARLEDPRAGEAAWNLAESGGPPKVLSRAAAAWAPSKGIFGPTTGMDPRLFDEDGELRPVVRGAIMEKLDQALRVDGGVAGSDWQTWLKVYLAGGSASEWAGERPNETAQDLDILLGVDYKRARENQSGSDPWQHSSPEQITRDLNECLRKQFNEPGWEAPFGGYWDVTGYVNPRAWNIASLKPYAAYDLSDMRWAVKPPHLPEHSAADFDPAVLAEGRAVASWARAILRIQDPAVRRREATALWESLHRHRDMAFSDEGQGWQDPGNLIEKYVAYSNGGLLDKIKDLVHAEPQQRIAAAQSYGPYYHAGTDPFSRTDNDYIHVGTRAAAGDRHGGDRTVHEVYIHASNPMNNPHHPLDDTTANAISIHDAIRNHLGREPLAEDFDPDFEDAPEQARGSGWKPEHDAVFYENGAEDPGSISAMVRPSALRRAHTASTEPQQHTASAEPQKLPAGRRDARWWSDRLHSEYGGEGIHSILSTPSSRAAIGRHLDAQGLPHDNPLRGVLQHNVLGTHNLIHRGADGKIDAGINYSYEKRSYWWGHPLTIHDVRVLPQRQGTGSAMLRDLAARHPEAKSMSVHGAIDTAIPWYEKHGATFHPGFHTGEWDEAAMDRLRGKHTAAVQEYQTGYRPEYGPGLHEMAGHPDIDLDYASYYGPADQVRSKIKEASGKPDQPVTVYRAGGAPQHGDWVSLTRHFAEDHASGHPGMKVHEATVPAQHIRYAYSDWADEAGYFPGGKTAAVMDSDGVDDWMDAPNSVGTDEDHSNETTASLGSSGQDPHREVYSRLRGQLASQHPDLDQPLPEHERTPTLRKMLGRARFFLDKDEIEGAHAEPGRASILDLADQAARHMTTRRHEKEEARPRQPWDRQDRPSDMEPDHRTYGQHHVWHQALALDGGGHGDVADKLRGSYHDTVLQVANERHAAGQARDFPGSGLAPHRPPDLSHLPEMPGEQRRAWDSPHYQREQLALAKNPVPGTKIWRGESRADLGHAGDTSSVGMHWSVHPSNVVTMPHEDRPVVWQARLGEHPDEQIIPRSHPMWSGVHMSMDNEAEVRMRPGASVHVEGAWVGNHGPRGQLVPEKPEHNGPGWTWHPVDRPVPVKYTGHGATDYSDFGIHREAAKPRWFHGSPWRIPDGGMIEPGQDPVNSDVRQEHTFFTSDPHHAAEWAKTGTDIANEEGEHGWTANPHVYEVEEPGEHEPDPTGEFEGDRRSRHSLRIVRERHDLGLMHDFGCPGCAAARNAKEAVSSYNLSDRAAMISLDVPPGVIHSVDGGVDDHHITVVYLGKGVDDDSFEYACKRAAEAAAGMQPLKGTLSGLGTFPASNSSDGKIPAFVPVNVPGIHELRDVLADLSTSEYQDYVPHVTLGYFERGEPLPSPHPEVPVHFMHLTVHRGKDEVRHFPLGG
jgi:ribosomal protein S18 acetylase RimI-like enzyme/2'-5' RNA ligase